MVKFLRSNEERVSSTTILKLTSQITHGDIIYLINKTKTAFLKLKGEYEGGKSEWFSITAENLQKNGVSLEHINAAEIFS